MGRESKLPIKFNAAYLQNLIPPLQMLQQLITWDQQLFLYLNGLHTDYLDTLMYRASDPWTWLPFYLWLVVYIWLKWKKLSFYMYFYIGLLLAASDQLSSHLIKPWVKRPRPSYVPAWHSIIHLSPAGPGGHYGFVSGHATNTFALAFFLAFILPKTHRWLKCILFAWATLVSYSRIYNGVHYPGDILGGMLLAALVAFLFNKIFRYFLGAYVISYKRLFD